MGYTLENTKKDVSEQTKRVTTTENYQHGFLYKALWGAVPVIKLPSLSFVPALITSLCNTMAGALQTASLLCQLRPLGPAVDDQKGGGRARGVSLPVCFLFSQYHPILTSSPQMCWCVPGAEFESSVLFTLAPPAGHCLHQASASGSRSLWSLWPQPEHRRLGGPPQRAEFHVVPPLPFVPHL
ncbi:uncharacterized protein LOC128929259 [Callithrix jacchus]